MYEKFGSTVPLQIANIGIERTARATTSPAKPRLTTTVLEGVDVLTGGTMDPEKSASAMSDRLQQQLFRLRKIVIDRFYPKQEG